MDIAIPVAAAATAWILAVYYGAGTAAGLMAGATAGAWALTVLQGDYSALNMTAAVLATAATAAVLATELIPAFWGRTALILRNWSRGDWHI